jgi:amidase
VEERHVSELNGMQLGDYLGWLVMTCAISVTGCPVLALPCGFTPEGLPVGVQVIGPVGSDARLIAIGAYLEQVLDVSPRVPIEPRDTA